MNSPSAAHFPAGRPALRFLLPPLPALAAALCPYMAAARSQSAQSECPIHVESVRDEKGGKCKQKGAPEPNNAAHQHRLPNCPAGSNPGFTGGERSRYVAGQRAGRDSLPSQKSLRGMIEKAAVDAATV